MNHERHPDRRRTAHSRHGADGLSRQRQDHPAEQAAAPAGARRHRRDHQRVRRDRARPPPGREVRRRGHGDAELGLPVLHGARRPGAHHERAVPQALQGRGDAVQAHGGRDHGPGRSRAHPAHADDRSAARLALPPRRRGDHGRRRERRQHARQPRGGGEAGRRRRPPAAHQESTSPTRPSSPSSSSRLHQLNPGAPFHVDRRRRDRSQRDPECRPLQSRDQDRRRQALAARGGLRRQHAWRRAWSPSSWPRSRARS